MITPILYVVPDEKDVKKVAIASLSPNIVDSSRHSAHAMEHLTSTIEVTGMDDLRRVVPSSHLPASSFGLTCPFLLTRTRSRRQAASAPTSARVRQADRRSSRLVPDPNPGAMADDAKSASGRGLLGPSRSAANESTSRPTVRSRRLYRPPGSPEIGKEVDKAGVRIAVPERSSTSSISRARSSTRSSCARKARKRTETPAGRQLDALAGLRTRWSKTREIPGSRIWTAASRVQQAAGTPRGAPALSTCGVHRGHQGSGIVAKTIETEQHRGSPSSKA